MTTGGAVITGLVVALLVAGIVWALFGFRARPLCAYCGERLQPHPNQEIGEDAWWCECCTWSWCPHGAPQRNPLAVVSSPPDLRVKP